MDWTDEGIVIGLRKHGETSVILELLTRDHGRHLGIVRGGRSRRLRPVLQPGNSVLATWRARLDEHLGTYVVETTKTRAGRIMEHALTLHALNHLCALARLLPERDPHSLLQRTLAELLDAIEDGAGLPVRIIRFELLLLADLGFGLDLTACALTGSQDDLCFVSPKSGRAVSRSAGAPYGDRILALPAFLAGAENAHSPVCADDLRAGFRLTEHFLTRDVFAPRGLPVPEPRRSYLTALAAEADWPGFCGQTGRSAVRVSP